MLRLITDELVSIIFIGAVLTLGWFEVGKGSPILFAVLAILFLALYTMVFFFLKVYSPSLYLKNGNNEECVRYCTKALRSPYSIVRFLKTTPLVNFYKLNSAYAALKMDDLSTVQEMIKDIDDQRILKGQYIQYRILKAFILVNGCDFEKALELLISINTGTLSPRFMHELFYLISLCYLELGKENERALKYAEVALNLKKNKPDYALNSAIANYLCEKDVRGAKTAMYEVFKDYEKLTSLSKPRILYYLGRVNGELGNRETEQELYARLKNDFPLATYLKTYS